MFARDKRTALFVMGITDEERKKFFSKDARKK
jgi:hypothetical protein